MANKYTFKMIIKGVIDFAKINIADLATKELNNTDKKNMLDKAIKGYLVSLLAGANVNLITKWVIEKYVLENIPVFTQHIYDLIKAKVKGVTK